MEYEPSPSVEPISKSVILRFLFAGDDGEAGEYEVVADGCCMCREASEVERTYLWVVDAVPDGCGL